MHDYSVDLLTHQTAVWLKLAVSALLTTQNNDFECAGQTQCVFWNYTDEKSIQNRLG